MNLPFLDVPNDQCAIVLTAQTNQKFLVGSEGKRFHANSMQFMSTFLFLLIPIPYNHIRSISHVTYLTRRHKCTAEIQSQLLDKQSIENYM